MNLDSENPHVESSVWPAGRNDGEGSPGSPFSRDLPVQEIMVLSVYERENYGIARFPLEEAAFFRQQGFRVTLIGITPKSQADRVFDLTKFPALWHWLAFCFPKKQSAISFHFYDALAFPEVSRFGLARWFGRLIQTLAIAFLARGSRHSRVMIHELPLTRKIGPLRRWATGFCLSRFPRIEFFTAVVRESALAVYPFLKSEQTVVVKHDRYMANMGTLSKSEARQKLDLRNSNTIFLCIGWWAPQKGFPDAMRAFAAAAPEKGEMWVVGDIPDGNEAAVECKRQIEELAQLHANIHARNEYVSDEVFDLWLRAADYVVLPYVSSTNSGVGARARVAECGLIIKGLETLRGQFPDALVFDSPESLAALFKHYAVEKAGS